MSVVLSPLNVALLVLSIVIVPSACLARSASFSSVWPPPVVLSILAVVVVLVLLSVILVVLVVLIVTDSHLDKTALNPEKRTYIKGKDALLGWLVAVAMRYPDPEPGSVADMILNWVDGEKDIIDPTLGTDEINKFKDTKRGQ